MSRCAPLLLAALLPACLAASQPVPDRGQDDQLVRQIADQSRWAREAVQSRAEKDELDAAREDDAEAVADLRKRFRKQTAAIARTTWIREAVVLELEQGAADEAALVSDFDQAAQARMETIEAADEIAQALAASKVAKSISLGELRSAMLEVHRAQEIEQRLAKSIGRSADGARGGSPPDAGPGKATPAAPALARLQTVTLPVPKPFVAAAAKLIELHPDEGKGLTSFGPKLLAEATEIRAELADLANKPPEPGPEAAPAVPAPSAAPASGEKAALAKAAPFTLGADAKKLVERRGLPSAVVPREDGLLALRYQESRPCNSGTCPAPIDYLFDAQGKLVRDQPVQSKP